MFGKIGGDTFRLKVDESNEQHFENKGMKPYHSEKKKKGMPYWEVPQDVLEDRTELEIQSNMCSILDPSSDNGLVAYWRLNEGLGHETSDLTANNNHGILVNSPEWQGDDPCAPLLIDESSNELSFNLAPNPMTDFSILQLANQTGQTYKVEIFNISGQLIMAMEISDSKPIRIDNESFLPGMYLVQISKEFQIVGIEKLIIE